MRVSIDNLRVIARCCLTGEPLEEELSRWLGSSLQEFLHHRCHSVDEALGLRFAQGGVPWWREEAIRKRDVALRELAGRFYAGLLPSAQARKIHSIAKRYAASAWRFDRRREAMPRAYAGTEKEFLWRAFKSGAAMPICERQLRNILPRRPGQAGGLVNLAGTALAAAIALFNYFPLPFQNTAAPGQAHLPVPPAARTAQETQDT